MAALATQALALDGTAPTFGAASTADTVETGNGHNTFVVWKNGSEADVTATIVVPGDNSYGESNPDVVVTVPASGEAWLKVPKEADALAGDGRAAVTLSAATTVTVAVVQVG